MHSGTELAPDGNGCFERRYVGGYVLFRFFKSELLFFSVMYVKLREMDCL